MTALRRFASLLAAILRPWWVGLALIAAADAALMQTPALREIDGPFGFEEVSHEVGWDFAVEPTDGPLHRALVLEWSSSDPSPDIRAWEQYGEFLGIQWQRAGFGKEYHVLAMGRMPDIQPTRPPGTPTTDWSVRVPLI
ncbi:MAG: hypothetical protein AAF907_02235 [Planctomycetota bacterium]